MKMNVRISVLAMVVVIAGFAHAQNGPSVNGDFVIDADAHSIEFTFHARKHNNGTTSGEMTFGATLDLTDQDVDGQGNGSGAGLLDVSMTVQINCLRIVGNQAALSGTVTQATTPSFVGRRALLAIEDNGEGVKAGAPDRFVWGLYSTQSGNWTASDAELLFDPGVGLTWHATDAERTDDVGIPSHPGTTVDCQSFPLASYSFEDLPHGAGNIQVKP